MEDNMNIKKEDIFTGDLIRVCGNGDLVKSQIYEVFEIQNVLAFNIRKACDCKTFVYTPIKENMQAIIEVYRKTDNSYELVYPRTDKI